MRLCCVLSSLCISYLLYVCASRVRSDFTQTLYFGPHVATDAESGVAHVSFRLSDSITSFNVMAEAVQIAGADSKARNICEWKTTDRVLFVIV